MEEANIRQSLLVGRDVGCLERVGHSKGVE